MAFDLTENADIIDVRDMIERFEELETESEDDLPMSSDNAEEFTAIKKILEELCGNGGDEQWRGDWYPVTLIKDSHFNDSMDELVADCYEVPKDLPSFMTITIDYDMLQLDYCSIEIGTETYWYR